MAEQKGIIILKGSLYGKTYFSFKGKHFVKKKSSLNKERFYTDPAFSGSMVTAGHTKIMAPLASMVYWQLPKKFRGHGIIGKMIGEAGSLFRAGLSETEIKEKLFQKFGGAGN